MKHFLFLVLLISGCVASTREVDNNFSAIPRNQLGLIHERYGMMISSIDDDKSYDSRTIFWAHEFLLAPGKRDVTIKIYNPTGDGEFNFKYFHFILNVEGGGDYNLKYSISSKDLSIAWYIEDSSTKKIYLPSKVSLKL